MTKPRSAVCTCLALVPPCTRLSKQTRHSGSFLLANTPDLATGPRINKHSHTARLHTLTHTGARRSLTSTEPPRRAPAANMQATGNSLGWGSDCPLLLGCRAIWDLRCTWTGQTLGSGLAPAGHMPVQLGGLF
uniref:Uncharacterized protein n=1 Tax=Pipistrellus kuhlii TaxID=59472 RepID=A0A7J7UGB9_PIPKU|nr:hypothetical protein mPipKuh1_009085 [Pipistrellus kuhlii]